MNFTYSSLPWNIKFGLGSLSTLSEELDLLGKKKVLILTTPEQSDKGQQIAQMLKKNVLVYLLWQRCMSLLKL